MIAPGAAPCSILSYALQLYEAVEADGVGDVPTCTHASTQQEVMLMEPLPMLIVLGLARSSC